MKIIFYYQANKTHFHKKCYALGLVSRACVFGTRKWLIADVQYHVPIYLQHYFPSTIQNTVPSATFPSIPSLLLLFSGIRSSGSIIAGLELVSLVFFLWFSLYFWMNQTSSFQHRSRKLQINTTNTKQQSSTLCSYFWAYLFNLNHLKSSKFRIVQKGHLNS